MGWAGGSGLMAEIIKAAKPRMGEMKRINFYKPVIEAFMMEDCDTLGECIGMDAAFDTALHSIEPMWFEDDNG